MKRYKLATILLSDDDVRVLLESLWYSIQRGDVLGEDRERLYKIREQLTEKFNREGRAK